MEEENKKNKPRISKQNARASILPSKINNLANRLKATKFSLDTNQTVGVIEEESPSDIGIIKILKDSDKYKTSYSTIYQKSLNFQEIGKFSNQKSLIDLTEINIILTGNYENVNFNALNNLGSTTRAKTYLKQDYTTNNRNSSLTVLNNSMSKSVSKIGSKILSKKTLDSKKQSLNRSDGRVGNDLDESNQLNQIIKTDNSYFRKDLALYQDETKDLNKLILKYKENSHKYECILIKSLCEDYEVKLNKGTNNEKFSEFYETLIQEKDKLLGKNYEKLDKKLKDFKSFNSYCNYYIDLKVKAKEIIKSFINSLTKQIKQDNEESTSESNFIKWKKKISELLNTWDLFEANGINLKINIKYIPFRRMLIQRANRIRYNKELKLDDDKNKDLFGKFLILGGKISSNKKENSNLPTALFMKEDTIRILIDIGISLLLLYTFITFPLRLVSGGNDSNFYLFFEKFVDMLFYIDVITNMRTAYIDKSNNEIYDIKMITIFYLKSYFIIDFISSVSWKIFVIWDTTLYSILKYTVVFRILRIVKITPLLNKLEQLQSANYVRMFKLLLFYYIVLHWMSILITILLDESINWQNNNPSCFFSNNTQNKDQLKSGCMYIFTFNLAAYIVPGEYINDMNIIEGLNPSNEYIVLIIVYLIGSVLSAYIFGGMASIIQNLNQGQNFFTEKTDLLREHMIFYDIPEEIQSDISCYYDYLWQRHKDIIYGKHHFNLLSRSLREKFERMNLPGNEVYLKLFYTLGNLKLIDEILLGLKKYIAFPKEILFAEGSLIYGIYILVDGDVILVSENNHNVKKVNISITFGDVLREVDEQKKNLEKADELEGDNNIVKKTKETLNTSLIENSVIFPLISAFLKTGRTYQKCYCIDFTDFLYLPTENFDQIINIFPIEMHMLKHQLVKLVEEQKLFENESLFDSISKPSARSIGSYYEKSYDKYSIWIPIPIPISQRKIAKNYIPFFLNKINFLHKEIILSCDLDICFNSNKITNLFKNKVKGKNTSTNKKQDKKEKKDSIKNTKNSYDILENIKNLGKTVQVLGNELSLYQDKFKQYLEDK